MRRVYHGSPATRNSTAGPNWCTIGRMDTTVLLPLAVAFGVGLALGALLGGLLGALAAGRRNAALALAGRRGLQETIEPVRGDLARLQALLAESRAAGVASGETLRRQVSEELRRVADLVQRVGADAQGLKAALQGNVNARGQWGEAVLEQLLRNGGLLRGIHYDVQPVVRGTGPGDVRRPDLVVHLPDGASVVVDSKAVFPDYARYVSSETPEAQRAALRALVQAMRSTVRDLASRHYERRVEGSIEFVLMFLPLEGVLQAAFAADPALLTDAMAHNVVPVGPSALIAMVTLLQRLWRRSEQERNTARILDAARALAERVAAFGADLETLGTELDRAGRAYDEALRRLRGPRGVAASMKELASLHVQPARPLPAPLREEKAPGAPPPSR